MKHPLSLRISSDIGTRDITEMVGDSVSFQTMAPGGYGPCTFDFPRRLTDPALAGATVWLDDNRTGEPLHEGSLVIPGRATSESGSVFQATSVGPQVHASDRTGSFIGLDTSLEAWEERLLSPPSSTVGSGTHPDDEDLECLLLQFAEGNYVGPGSKGRASMEYNRLVESGQKLGGVLFDWDSGLDDGKFRTQAIATSSTGTPANEIIRDIPFARANADRTMSIESAIDSHDFNVPVVRIQRDGPATGHVGTDAWTAIATTTVRAQFRDRQGNVITGAWPGSDTFNFNAAPNITADYLVLEILRLFCPDYDLAGARIDPATFHISQFAYPDPVRAMDLLNAITVLEPGHTWLVWEGSDTGNRFEFKAWQDGRNGSTPDPRYVFDDQVDLDLPGTEEQQANRLTVNYFNRRKQRKSVTVSANVPMLDRVSRKVWAPPVELGEELGVDRPTASDIGDRLLADYNERPVSGTFAVRTPVLDRYTGRRVWPWEIRAGDTCQAQVLSAGQADDAPILRITQTDFSDASGVAQITAGEPPPRDQDAVIEQLTRRLLKLQTVKHWIR